MNAPELRFKKEDGSEYPDWKETTIGDIMEKQSIPIDVDKDKMYREIGIRSHGKGIFHKNPVAGSGLGNKRVFEIVPDCLVLNIVFAWERAVAKTTQDEVGMIASHRFPMYKPKEGVLDLEYIVRYLVTDKGKRLLELASPGGAGRNRTLGQQAFLDSELFLPCYDEQKDISNFLHKMDKVIETEEDEIESYKALKRGLLQKMFPRDGERKPEIRFPGFVDDWEQRKLGDFVQRQSNTMISDSDNPSVEYEDVISEQGELNKDIYLKTSEKNGIVFTEEDVLYGKLRPYLHNWLNPDFKGVAVGDWWVLRPINLDKNFLYWLIQTPQYDNAANQSSGTKMPRADWKLISNTDFYVPVSTTEQVKIAAIFENLNNLITLQQGELNAWRRFKEGIVRRIFI